MVHQLMKKGVCARGLLQCLIYGAYYEVFIAFQQGLGTPADGEQHPIFMESYHALFFMIPK